MSHSNQSIVIHSAGDLRVEARDVLEPDLGEILVKMQAGGICGSDLHYYQNGGFGPIKLREPMVLGLASKTSRLASWLQSLLPDHVSYVLTV